MNFAPTEQPEGPPDGQPAEQPVAPPAYVAPVQPVTPTSRGSRRLIAAAILAAAIGVAPSPSASASSGTPPSSGGAGRGKREGRPARRGHGHLDGAERRHRARPERSEYASGDRRLRTRRLRAREAWGVADPWAVPGVRLHHHHVDQPADASP